MRINNLNIERFGRKSNLVVDGIQDHLNVVYGPNGSGKSTLINFVRWMLFGNHDDVIRRYVGYGTGYDDRDSTRYNSLASGSLTFFDNGQRRSISRRDDGSRYGFVAFDGDSHYAKQSTHLASLVGNMSASDFDALYAPDFGQDFGLSRLLQSSLARGIDLTSRSLPSDRVQELRLRIDNYRRDLDQLPWTSGDLQGLQDRKHDLERRMEAVIDENRRRRLEYDREYEELNRRIQDLELEIDRLRTEWHSRDEDVKSRRNELELAWKAAQEAREEYLSRRRNELSEIDAHISRARSMQTELQRRYDRLESQLRSEDLQLDRSVTELEESNCLVQSIAKQLDGMRQYDLPEIDAARFRRTHVYRGAQPTYASLDMLRSEVGRLCETLQRERSSDRVRAMATNWTSCGTRTRRCNAGLWVERPTGSARTGNRRSRTSWRLVGRRRSVRFAASRDYRVGFTC